jgi:hypothetical protein
VAADPSVPAIVFMASRSSVPVISPINSISKPISYGCSTTSSMGPRGDHRGLGPRVGGGQRSLPVRGGDATFLGQSNAAEGRPGTLECLVDAVQSSGDDWHGQQAILM